MDGVSTADSPDLPGPMRTLVIADYDPAWPRLFERETLAVRTAVPTIPHVEHVGSTAVPGLSATPTVDLLAGTADPSALDADRLGALGYVETALPEADRRFFWKGTEAFQTYHLHLVYLDGPLWRRFLAFRDRLRADLALAERYDHHKRQALRRGGDGYAEAKAAFIDGVLDGAGA